MEIRRGKEQDAYDFILVMKQFLKEAKYPFRVDAEMTIGNFKSIVGDENFLVLIAEDEGEIVGFLVAALNTTLFSLDKIAVELGWYLQPGSRDAKTAFKLVNTFEQWAKNQGCRHVSMADIDILQDLRPLYERKGYRLTEKTYTKEI